MKLRVRRVALAAGLAVGLALAGCTADADPQPTPETDAAMNQETFDALEPSITADFQCGQLSLLATYQLRLDQGLSGAEGDEAGRAAQERMLEDLWASLLEGDTAITPHIRDIKEALEEGDTVKYSEASEAASSACTENGTGIQMGFLPGEGG
ncbi:hypothetical protein [Leucobacter tenebrionis]|uniref:hypothetical protein n=1 Tax=Leucobacter tenebrionis TaxID=2873270 RepID=UPI001CA6014E|nr:hypothetical protein [Leucobacter tenebrionis]QZY52321.1 hypothetical protein KVY00_02290 [Leucobacter tenebrionis]